MLPPPRVGIFVDGSDPLGGVTEWSRAFARGSREELDIRLYALETEPAPLDYAGLFLDRDEAVPIHFAGDPLACADDVIPENESIAKLLADTTVVFPNYFELPFRLAAKARDQGKKVFCIAVCHTDEEHYYRLFGRYSSLISSFVATSRKTHHALLERYPDRSREISLIPNAVEVGPRSVCAQPGSGQKLRALYVGRLEQRQKRILDLVEIICAARTLGVDISLTIAGAGGDEKELSARAAKTQGAIRLLGPIPRSGLAELYRAHDIFLSASAYEGMSLAMLESMAHGLVPVVTAVSGVEDVLSAKVAGQSFPAGDIRAAAEALQELDQNRGLLKEMSARARRTIEEGHDVKQQCRALSSLVRYIVAGS